VAGDGLVGLDRQVPDHRVLGRGPDFGERDEHLAVGVVELAGEEVVELGAVGAGLIRDRRGQFLRDLADHLADVRVPVHEMDADGNPTSTEHPLAPTRWIWHCRGQDVRYAILRFIRAEDPW
jgi:hypothetical protein